MASGQGGSPHSITPDTLGSSQQLACAACGFGNLPTQNFCGNCGTPLKQQATVLTQEPVPVPPPPEATLENLANPPHSGLQQFAYISLELMNLVQLTSRYPDPAIAAQVQQECLLEVEHRIAAYGGVIEAIRNTIVFASFPGGDSLDDSLADAITFVQDILGHPVVVEGQPVKIRIGLDIEDALDRQPMRAATERSVATPDTVVVSQQVYDLVEEVFHAEPIGPLRVGNRSVTFYKLLRPKQDILPSDSILEDWPTETHPVDEPPITSYPVEALPETTAAQPNLTETDWEESTITTVPQAEASVAPITPIAAQAAPAESTGLAYHQQSPNPVDIARGLEAVLAMPDPLVSEAHSVPLPPEPGVEDLPVYSEQDLAAPEASTPPLMSATTPLNPKPTIPRPIYEDEIPQWIEPETVDDDEEVFESTAPAASLSSESKAAPSLAIESPPPPPATPITLGQAVQDTALPPADASMPLPDKVPNLTGFGTTATGPDLDLGMIRALGIDPDILNEANSTAHPPMGLEEVVLDDRLKMSSGYRPPLLGSLSVQRGPGANTHRYDDVVQAIATRLKNFIEHPDGTGQVISLQAADGMGKSWISQNMLPQQLLSDPQNPNLFLMIGSNYRAFHQEQLPLMMWVELFHNSLPIPLEGIEAKTIQEGMAQRLNNLYQGNVTQDTIDFFTDFLSANPLTPISIDTLDELERAERYLLDYFVRLSQQKPLVLMLENLHLADVASLDLLARLLKRGLLDHAICVYLTYEDDFYPQGELQRQLAMNAHTEYHIAPFTEAEIPYFLGSGPFSGTLQSLTPTHLNQLTMYSKGNPLYLFESIAYLAVKQVFLMDPKTERLMLNPEVDDSVWMLPPSVKDMIRYRLSLIEQGGDAVQLDEELRQQAIYVLQLASVMGERFTLQQLLLLSQIEQEPLIQILQYLTQQWLISADGMTGYFRHRVIWELVYESIPEDTRARMHQLVSESLEQSLNVGVSVNPALIAYHADRGGLAKRAFQYWNLTGVYQSHVGSVVGLNMAFSKALEGIDAAEGDDPAMLKHRLLENMGILNIEESPQYALGLLEPVLQFYRNRGDVAHVVETLGYMASGHESLGNIQQALDYLNQTLECLPAGDYPEEHATMQITRMEYLVKLGRFQKALELFHSQIAPATQGLLNQPQSPYFETTLIAQIKQAEVMLSQLDTRAFGQIETLLRTATEHKLAERVADLKLLRAKGLLYTGNYDSAQRSLLSMLEPIEALPRSELYVAQWGELTINTHAALGEWKPARDLVLHCLYQAEKAKDHHTWVMLNIAAGRVAMGEGQWQNARHIMEAMTSEASERRFATCALMSWRYLADIALAQQDYDNGIEIATRALEIALKDDVRNLREAYLLGLSRARLLLALGDIKAAGEQLQGQWPSVKDSGFLPLVADNACAIGELYTAMAAKTNNLAKEMAHRQKAQEFYGIALGQWQRLKNTYQSQLVSARMSR